MDTEDLKGLLFVLVITTIGTLFFLTNINIRDNCGQQAEARANARDSIAAEIRRYKLDSIRLELAIIEADMRNESLRDSIRMKLKATKP